jgi:hypothetical protein
VRGWPFQREVLVSTEYCMTGMNMSLPGWDGAVTVRLLAELV